jgi:site-specific recombinase XerD
MDLGHAKRIFITAKKSESVTISTLETYERGLKKFFDYLIAQDVLDLAEVDTRIIREYLIALKEKGLRGITVHQSFRILRTLFKFLHQESYLIKNPMVNVKAPKIEQKEMRTFNSQEISKILNAFDTEDFIGMRNYCIMCLLFSTGIRKTEMFDLTITDINITNESIRIANGKGQKERFAPIGRALRRTLMKYLTMR